MSENKLVDKSLAFSVRIVKLYQYLARIKGEYIISKQIIRSGTSIGANITEANYGQSKADFTAKMQIALKETAETEYWLKLLYLSQILKQNWYESILNDCLELKRMLIATVNTSKNNKE